MNECLSVCLSVIEEGGREGVQSAIISRRSFPRASHAATSQ